MESHDIVFNKGSGENPTRVLIDKTEVETTRTHAPVVTNQSGTTTSTGLPNQIEEDDQETHKDIETNQNIAAASCDQA